MQFNGQKNFASCNRKIVACAVWQKLFLGNSILSPKKL